MNLAANREHTISKGVCTRCNRSGAELKIACPGYPTAGEFIKLWPKRIAAPANKTKKRR